VQGYPLEYANKQKRTHWQYAEGEREHLQRLSGYERVKLTLCTTKELLPDEDARIFTQVRRLGCFVVSPACCVVFPRLSVNSDARALHI
jgi:hypothetical protein